MSRWTALLLFPVVPAASARRLDGSLLAIAMPLMFAAAIAAFFLGAGARAGDAWLSALTYARYSYGLAVGGTVLGGLAIRIVNRDASWMTLLGPACAAAAWAPFAFVATLGLASLAGAGAAAGLYAGVLVLLWAAYVGMAILGGSEGAEPGRLLVATCLGLSGCLFGFWAAHKSPPPVAVTAVRAPFRARDITPGDILLVRSDADPAGPCVVLLREPGTPEAVFAHLDQNGSRTILGDVSVPAEMLQEWNIAGRVFFRFGGTGGWSVVGTEQIPQLSQD